MVKSMIPINEVNGPYFWYGSINGIYIYTKTPPTNGRNKTGTEIVPNLGGQFKRQYRHKGPAGKTQR